MATKILTKDLRIGMFVTDLDRPWVDTPFLLQGFLIEDQEQIAAIKSHCEFVIIDRARSVGDEYEAPSAAVVAVAQRTATGQAATTTKAPSAATATAAPPRAPDQPGTTQARP